MSSSTWRSYFTSIIEPNSNTPSSNVPEDDADDDDGYDNDCFDDKLDALPTKTVIERPCSLILAEEFISIPPLGYDTSSSSANLPQQKRKFKSWHRSFSNLFPHQFGIAYTKWSLSDPQNYDHNEGDSAIASATKMTFDTALSTMKSDFRTLSTLIQNPILIARGPALSWMAQFYLESLPLAGLILIDPIPFSTERAYQLYQSHYHDNKYNTTMSSSHSSNKNRMILSKEYYDTIQDYSEHWDHWTLKIEPGSIPMMILSTKVSESMHMDDDIALGVDENGEQLTSSSDTNTEPTDVEDIYLWREYAEQTAQRHSGSTTTETGVETRTTTTSTVPVMDIDPYNIKQCSTVINDWIHDKVL